MIERLPDETIQRLPPVLRELLLNYYKLAEEALVQTLKKDEALKRMAEMGNGQT